jgi:hypothetical protein
MKNFPPIRPVASRTALATARVAAGATLTLACAAAAGGEPSPIQSYYDFVHWMSMRRPDLALQQFTNDAVVVAGPACTPSAPCVGKEAIRTGYFGALRAGQVSLPVYDQRFDRWQLRTRGEPVDAGDPLLRRAYVFEFQRGRIATLKSQPDVGDPAAAALFGQLSEKP